MSRTRGHGKRTKAWGEAWSRRAALAGIVGWWLDAAAKRATHRAERRAARWAERQARIIKEEEP